MDIREFLANRLAEDQKVAEDAGALDTDWPFWVEADDAAELEAADAFRRRHGPARVLCDVEAKRRVLAAYVDDDRVRFGDWETCSDSCPVSVLDEVVKLLALPYAEHSDYDPTWSPENVVPHV